MKVMIPPTECALRCTRRFYDRNVKEYVQATEGLDMNRVYARFLEHVRVGGDVLDAGCGSGRDSIRLARDFGCQVLGMDASQRLVAHARTKGVHAVRETFQEMKWDRDFDGLWASASLVHVPRADILAVLRRFFAALRETGVAFISVKRGAGEAFAADGRFFSYYYPEEFLHLARLGGFEIVRYWSSTEGSIDAGWMQFILRRPAIAGATVKGRHDRSAPIALVAA